MKKIVGEAKSRLRAWAGEALGENVLMITGMVEVIIHT